MQRNDATTVGIVFICLFACFWIYALLRVAKDISRRTSHLGTQVLCVFLIVVLTPIVGLPVYFLLRPITRKDLIIEQQAFTDMLQAQTIHCYLCGGANSYEHMYCAFCGEKLKQQCPSCTKRFSLEYAYCPYCATPSPLLHDPAQDQTTT